MWKLSSGSADAFGLCERLNISTDTQTEITRDCRKILRHLIFSSKFNKNMSIRQRLTSWVRIWLCFLRAMNHSGEPVYGIQWEPPNPLKQLLALRSLVPCRKPTGRPRLYSQLLRRAYCRCSSSPSGQLMTSTCPQQTPASQTCSSRSTPARPRSVPSWPWPSRPSPLALFQ